jgi:dihydrofolate synthase/folylpolyglutamate synthase
LAALGHPQRHFPAIHVGGTNGKGSTCAFLVAELSARGLRVGLYTSPHLVSVRERIMVGGAPISEDAFAEWAWRLRPEIERFDASFFEAVTAIAFADLAARGVDIAVVEVGLGGRLDATNVLTPLVAVVTKIAREHTDYLGWDMAGIAREKAGIAKPGVPFVTGEPDPAIRAVLVAEAERLGAKPVRAVDAGRAVAAPLGLRGPHQARNARVAMAALDALPARFGGGVGDTVPPSFAWASVPGRFDVRGSWIFDVAHNPDGMAVLATALAGESPRRPLHALVGIRSDKEWPGMLAALAPVVDRLVLTAPPSIPPAQQWSGAALAAWSAARAGAPPVAVELDFDRALADARSGAGTVLVTGSFHTVGDALARLPGFAPLG